MRLRQVENSLEGSLEVAHTYYQDLAGNDQEIQKFFRVQVAGEKP